MIALILSFLPQNALPLVIVLLGFALILGIVKRQVVFGILGSILLFALLSPFIDAIFNALPIPVIILLSAIFFMGIVRMTLNVTLGRGATDHFLGALMYGIFMAPFRFLGYLVRGGR